MTENEMANQTKLSVKVAKLAQGSPPIKEALTAFEAAMKAAADAKAALTSVIRETPEWRVLQGAGDEPRVVVSNYGNVELVSLVRHSWEPRPETLAPQTLNALITGKLLNDDEKRQLLANQGIRLTKPAQPGEEGVESMLLHFSDFNDEIPF